MSVSIVGLDIENVKRVRAVAITPAASGLTVIGGNNCAGKTSILDAISYALGGEKYRPTNLQRDGGISDARIEIVLSNGLKVERKGKNASLQVTDPKGMRGGQKLLDAFVEELAINLPKFLAMNAKEKASVLLRIIGIGDKLAALDREEREACDERTAQGRLANQKANAAAELPEFPDAPDAPVSVSDLAREVQEITARNTARANARRAVEEKRLTFAGKAEAVSAADAEVSRLADRLSVATANCEMLRSDLARAEATLQAAEAEPISEDESPADVYERMNDAERINSEIRANQTKRAAVADARRLTAEYEKLTANVEAVRASRLELLAGSPMPLPGLSVEDGELTLNGKAWDCMSSAEQIRAGAAIVRKLKPECGFILLDGLERMDAAQLADIGDWLTAEGLQGIATRVSTGSECTLIIEDGMVARA